MAQTCKCLRRTTTRHITMPRFYKKDGSTFETRYYKDGAPLGGLPRTTDCDAVLAKRGLDEWKIKQAVQGAIKAKESGFDDEAAAEAAVQYVEMQSQVAADAGTEAHAIVEAVAAGKKPNTDTTFLRPEVANAIVDAYKEWHKSMTVNGYQDLDAEATLINLGLGYGGRCDKRMTCENGIVIVDFKSQDVRRLKKDNAGRPEYYDSWVRQLAAYAAATHSVDIFSSLPKSVSACNVVIDRLTGEFFTQFYTYDELNTGWEQFKRTHWLWCSTHEYDINLALSVKLDNE